MYELANIFLDQGRQPPFDTTPVTYAIQNCLELERREVGLTYDPNTPLFTAVQQQILGVLAGGCQVGLSWALGIKPKTIAEQLFRVRNKLDMIPPDILDNKVPNIYSVGSRANYMATTNPLPEGDQFVPGLMTLGDEQRLWNTEQPPEAKVLTHAICTQAEARGTEITPEILPCQREMLLALLAAGGQPLTGLEIAANIGYSPTIIGPQMLSLRDVVAQYSFKGAQLMLPSSPIGYYLYLKVV